MADAKVNFLSYKTVDYRLLAEAQSFYEGHGFEYLELPWAVSAQAVGVTLPANKNAFALTPGSYLVGSAEQSFIELMMQGIPLDKHCAITPCFRDDAEDEWHQKYFMKLEFFRFLPLGMNKAVVQKYLRHAVDIALEFHGQHLAVETMETPEGTDIVCARTGVELGSYGVRWLDDVGGWIFGTGAAEPRLSTLVRLQKETPLHEAAERRLKSV